MQDKVCSTDGNNTFILIPKLIPNMFVLMPKLH